MGSIVGLKFRPNDKDLISHLRWKVNGGGDSFIKDVDVYGSEPWLLPHVTEPLFQDNEWYYFVKKTIDSTRKRKRQSRQVQKKENGGTWKSTTGEEEIRDGGNAVVIGHARNLTFMENEVGSTKQMKTDWLMREYRLPSQESQEWVVCRIRRKSNGRVNGDGRRMNQGNLGINSSIGQNVEDAAFQPFANIVDDEYAWIQGLDIDELSSLLNEPFHGGALPLP
ncbi:PREDICTED: NAC domain-containing protein 6-like [Tarenaya hassleriana]|uniref:NAC domain-containing protein 6-like n=1 Tax=Tarenaya hassleriana TaxID=28532 RepID=UPI00053C851B|nr:PREDICTED: NAC domain-containing protein 6-like [Tarenaya hassleriana]